MSRIRVARVITRLNIGGPAIQAMLLAQRLDPARYESVLVTGVPGAAEGDMSSLRPFAGVSPVTISQLGRRIALAADVVAFVRLFLLFRRFRPHIVHTHMAKAGLLGRGAARLAGVPIVLHTYHGNVLRGYFGSLPSRVFLLLERALARASTRVIAISERQAREIVELGIASPDRIERVPLGLDLAPFRVAPRGRLRVELGIASDTPLVGIVARLVPIKAVDLFLDAAAAIRAERPDAIFVVAGDGEQRDDLRGHARALGIADSVRFLGWRADLAAIYGDLDVLALTSRNEGTPMSLIEGLAAGCAVVATAVGGVPDIVVDGRTGVLARAADAGDVARRVLELLGDPERRRALGAAGRDAVYPEHDASTLVARIDALYSRLAGRAAGVADPRS